MPNRKSSNRRYYLKNKEKILSTNKLWRQNHPNDMRDYKRKYKKTGKGKQTRKRWIQSNIEKIKASRYICTFIRRGNLTRDICAICGKENADAHHENYKLPFSIIWLCSKHHQHTHGANE